MHRALLLGAFGALASLLPAQSPLTTSFASNNGGSTGGQVFFDLTVGASDITICRIDVNSSAVPAAGQTLEVYLTAPGSSWVGNNTNAAAFTLVSTGSVNLAGINNPSICLLNAPVTLSANTTYGVALRSQAGVGGWGFRYFNGNSTVACTNCSYATAELSFQGGGAQNVPWSGLFQPRIFSGNIHYLPGTVAPCPPAAVAAASNYGLGCIQALTAYYELFNTASPFDLAGGVGVTNSFMMLPNGQGGYILAPGSNNYFTPTSPDLLLTDDSVSAAQAIPFSWNYPGGSTTALQIGSNGMVFAGAFTSTDFSPSVAELLSQGNRFAPLWRDLNPAAIDPITALRYGSVHYDVDPGNNAVYVTFQNIVNFGGSTVNNFQMAILNSGVVEYRYQDIDPTGTTIVGQSEGLGVADPGSIDLSTVVPLGTHSTGASLVPLTLTADALPLLGTSFNLVTSNIPATAVLSTCVLSFFQVSPGVELSGIGMPTCFEHISQTGPLGSSALLSSVNPSFNRSLTVPNHPSWLGAPLFAQSASLVPGINPLGVISSNGVAMTLGNL